MPVTAQYSLQKRCTKCQITLNEELRMFPDFLESYAQYVKDIPLKPLSVTFREGKLIHCRWIIPGYNFHETKPKKLNVSSSSYYDSLLRVIKITALITWRFLLTYTRSFSWLRRAYPTTSYLIFWETRLTLLEKYLCRVSMNFLKKCIKGILIIKNICLNYISGMIESGIALSNRFASFQNKLPTGERVAR